jgi:hypothetical protein
MTTGRINQVTIFSRGGRPGAPARSVVQVGMTGHPARGTRPPGGETVASPPFNCHDRVPRGEVRARSVRPQGPPGLGMSASRGDSPAAGHTRRADTGARRGPQLSPREGMANGQSPTDLSSAASENRCGLLPECCVSLLAKPGGQARGGPLAGAYNMAAQWQYQRSAAYR